ncbi:hypothetical protein J6590_106853, partial [Homalodisca vitripennis]
KTASCFNLPGTAHAPDTTYSISTGEHQPSAMPGQSSTPGHPTKRQRSSNTKSILITRDSLDSNNITNITGAEIAAQLTTLIWLFSEVVAICEPPTSCSADKGTKGSQSTSKPLSLLSRSCSKT